MWVCVCITELYHLCVPKSKSPSCFGWVISSHHLTLGVPIHSRRECYLYFTQNTRTSVDLKWGFSNSAPGVRMCEELIKTSLSIVEVLSQHHALTSPHHGVVSIPSSVYEAMNYSSIPSLVPSFLPSFSWNLSRPSLILQEREDLPVTNPLLIPANQISVCLCVPVHIRVCSRQRTARVFNDYWRMEVVSGRKQTGRMQVERKDLTSSEKEPRCGLLLLTVNSTGRHFNYHQSPQINFYSRRTRKRSHSWNKLTFPNLSHDGECYSERFMHTKTHRDNR